MERTYPKELSLTATEEEIVSRIRNRIGDSIVFVRDYLSATESTDDTTKVIADGLTYYNEAYKLWPYHLTVDGTTYSGATNPTVLEYQHLTFTTVSGGGTLRGKVLDFALETFKLSDNEIWTIYQNVDLTGLVDNANCITDYMTFLKACLDLIKILRTKRIKDDYSSITVRDADTEYVKEARGVGDPYKDLYTNIENELNMLIDKCNKDLYWDGIRLE
jgi:hypothetical protein